MSVRYVIQMKNGDYLKEQLIDSMTKVKVITVENPIDAMMLFRRSVAEDVLRDIIEGNTNLPVVNIEKDNQPKRVVKIKVDVSVVE